MISIESYKLLVNPFDQTSVKEILDFVEIPKLYVETDVVGTLYLNYLDKFLENHLEQRFVIPISSKRLNDLKRGKISVGDTFAHPETHWVFVTQVNELDGTIRNIYLLPNEVFQQLNSVESGYCLSVEEAEIRNDSPRAVVETLLTTLPTTMPDYFSTEFRPVRQLATVLYLYQHADLSQDIAETLATLTLPEILKVITQLGVPSEEKRWATAR